MDVNTSGVLYNQQPTGYTAAPEPSVGEQLASSEEFLQHFGLRLAQLIAPATPIQTVQQAISQTLAETTAISNGTAVPPQQATNEERQLELVFVHDCRNHGCNRLQCVLCKHNPNKRCTGNFAHKYWVGDKLLAKCEGEIQVELVDGMTGERVIEDLSDMKVELCILDGNKYNSRCREIGEQRMEILDECEVLKNQKGEPLMVAGGVANSIESPQVVLKFRASEAFVSLKEVKVTESSESVLAGTKRPPFRMVVRAVKGNGSRLNIRPAVSEEFVVVTKRTKNLKKQEIPSLDDPISKLNHIGKETVKKLNEIKASADEMNLDLKLPRELWRVTKVKEFQRVAKLCEADGHMQQKLKQLLKLSKEKWDAACEHAKTAVQVDNRMRAWYIKNMSVGLLYQCSLGDLRLDSPVALLQNRRHEGLDFMEVVPMEHQLPAQRDQVQASCEQAMRLWWEDYHPGWMIFTLGNQHFETLNQIIQYSQSSVIKGGLAPLQEDAYGGAEARANGLTHDFSSFGQKASDLSRRESLSFGGHHPWPAPQPGAGGTGSRGAHQMSAQEESAALLSQMFAQQLAGNQSYANHMPEEGRVGPKQPSTFMIEGSKAADGQGSEAGGSRSSAPNPFEGLTGLPFQAQQETGKQDATALAEASWNGPGPGWMEQLGALGSVNSDMGQHNNATLLPSLLSLTNFAKNNSLGSFTSHNLADVSTLSSVPGEELIPGMDAKARGEEGKCTGTELLGTAPGQVLVGPGKGAFGGGAHLTEWGQQRISWDEGNPQETAGPSGRRNQEEEKLEGSDQYQGMLWKQLQQQRQQQQKREDGFGTEASQQQQRRGNGSHVSGLAKSGGHGSAVAHFTQLQRGRTPSGSLYDESNQVWTRAPSSSPQPEPHVRSRPSSGAHRDPRGNRPSSLSCEPDEAQGRAASGSPRHSQGKGKPSTFLSELAQAIEPSVRGKDHRQAQQKRKRNLASSDLPHKAKQRQSSNDTLPAGAAEAAPDEASERAQSQQQPSPWDGASAPGPSDNPAGLHGDSQRVETQRDAWDSSGDGLLSRDHPDQLLGSGPSDMYNSNPDAFQAAVKGSSRDHPPDGGCQYRSASPHADDPACMSQAVTQSNMPAVAHDLDRMVEHMTGHLHSSADEHDAEAEDEEATADENTDSDGKHSQPDVDVVN
ncbi:hypothetical protein WJX77_006198 [Trebouxia sp. C0004]